MRGVAASASWVVRKPAVMASTKRRAWMIVSQFMVPAHYTSNVWILTKREGIEFITVVAE